MLGHRAVPANWLEERGKFDPATLRFPYNLVPYLRRLPVSDIRDWKAIHDWASGVAEKLQPT